MLTLEEHKERRRQASAKYRAKNLEKVRETARLYVRNHPEQSRAYYLAHKDKAASNALKSYHKHKNTVDFKIKRKARAQAYEKTPKARYTHYQLGAKKRSLEFSLTFDQFMQFWQKPCDYCGDNIETIGLDRIDSTKGYEVTNVIPCCYDCNTMKMARSKESFFAKIKQIYDKHIKG
jgi:hypothetical protein